MTPKEHAMQVIGRLPDDADWEDVRECVIFVAAIHQALEELDEGKGISHDRIREEFPYG